VSTWPNCESRRHASRLSTNVNICKRVEELRRRRPIGGSKWPVLTGQQRIWWFARRLSRAVHLHRESTVSSIRGIRGARLIIQIENRGSRYHTWRLIGPRHYASHLAPISKSQHLSALAECEAGSLASMRNRQHAPLISQQIITFHSLLRRKGLELGQGLSVSLLIQIIRRFEGVIQAKINASAMLLRDR
jgi:hypothetical protein